MSDFVAGFLVCMTLFYWRMHITGEIVTWDEAGNKNPGWLTIPFCMLLTPVFLVVWLLHRWHAQAPYHPA